MIEFTIGCAICIPLFTTLAQADHTLGRSDDSSPGAVVDQKNPDQIGLMKQINKRNFTRYLETFKALFIKCASFSLT